MITNYCGELSIKCDSCREELSESDIDVEGFNELLAAIKKDGWKLEPVGGAWRHYCPDCQND